MPAKFTSLAVVLGFIERTLARGVPMRVALLRAERRYGVDRGVIKGFLRNPR